MGTREGRPGILCSERVFHVKAMKPGLSFKNLILLTAWPKRPMPSQTCAEFVTGIQSPVYNSCSFLLMRLHFWPDLLGFVVGQNYLRISVMPLSKNVALGQSLYAVIFFIFKIVYWMLTCKLLQRLNEIMDINLWPFWYIGIHISNLSSLHSFFVKNQRTEYSLVPR